MPKTDISQIAEYLFISSWPLAEHSAEIRALGIRLILSMHWLRPSRKLNQPPLRLLWLPTFDNPLFPIPVGILAKGVRQAAPVIQDGFGVLTHCRHGKHRSVAMACCVLIASGLNADEAMRLVAEKRAAADPNAWYIKQQIIRFERYWQENAHE